MMDYKAHLKQLVSATLVLSIIFGGVAGGIVGSLTYMFVSSKDNDSGENTTVRIVEERENTIESATIDVVEVALPAVVSVIATQELQLLPQRSFFFNDPFFWVSFF